MPGGAADSLSRSAAHVDAPHAQALLPHCPFPRGAARCPSSVPSLMPPLLPGLVSPAARDPEPTPRGPLPLLATPDTPNPPALQIPELTLTNSYQMSSLTPR